MQIVRDFRVDIQMKHELTNRFSIQAMVLWVELNNSVSVLCS